MAWLGCLALFPSAAAKYGINTRPDMQVRGPDSKEQYAHMKLEAMDGCLNVV